MNLMLMKKYLSSELKPIPTVNASLFSSKINLSSLVLAPNLCL